MHSTRRLRENMRLTVECLGDIGGPRHRGHGDFNGGRGIRRDGPGSGPAVCVIDGRPTGNGIKCCYCNTIDCKHRAMR